MERIYLDHAATTPVFPQVVQAMAELMLNHYGNPSSVHSFGQEAKTYLEEARARVAALIGAPAESVTFTSGGTEADNLVIFGAAELGRGQGRGHIITSAVEHHAILEACEEVGRHGFDLTVLPVDEYAMVRPEVLRQALRPDTLLVSIMHANNEVGTVNPIKELAALAHQAGALFHTDAVQSVGKIPCDVTDLDVDFLTYSSHKINGPKGVGCLYLRPGCQLYRRAWGGGQERRLRSGTENLPGIVGFGLAAQLTAEDWQDRSREWRRLSRLFIEEALNRIPHSHLHGHPSQRLPHNVNLGFDGVESEAILNALDFCGVACSAGSACSSGNEGQSHVLKAMGLPAEHYASLRFSLGRGVDEAQIRRTLDILQQRLSLLRSMSPFYQE